MFSDSALIPEIKRLQKFAFRLTRNTADADDLMQSTCLRALEKAELFEDGSNLYAWCSKIMYNIFVNNYRRKVKFESQFDPEPYLEKQWVAPSQHIHMDVSDVKNAMTSLSHEHNEILILICFLELPYQGVSELLQIPIGTVRSRLSRARENLQSVMAIPREHRRLNDRNKPLPYAPVTPAFIPLAASASA